MEMGSELQKLADFAGWLTPSILSSLTSNRHFLYAMKYVKLQRCGSYALFLLALLLCDGQHGSHKYI